MKPEKRKYYCFFLVIIIIENFSDNEKCAYWDKNFDSYINNVRNIINIKSYLMRERYDLRDFINIFSIINLLVQGTILFIKIKWRKI